MDKGTARVQAHTMGPMHVTAPTTAEQCKAMSAPAMAADKIIICPQWQAEECEVRTKGNAIRGAGSLGTWVEVFLETCCHGRSVRAGMNALH